LAAAVVVLCGCEAEERVVRYDPIFAGLKDAQLGMQPVGVGETVVDPTAMPEDQLVTRHEDGTVTLRAPAIRHVMVHMARAMAENDENLLYEEVVSEETKRHFSAGGGDPREATLNFLAEHQEDVLALFGRMNAAERTPGVRLTKVSPRGFRLEVSGKQANGLRFTALWVVMERGNWRFWWVD
jgi:hypothetical protein